MSLKAIRFNPSVRLPERKTQGAAAFDVYMPSAVILPPRCQAKIALGWGLKSMPVGHCMKFVIRSSWALKNVDVVGGLIDSDYIAPDNWQGLSSVDRNELFVTLENKNTITEQRIEAGERVFQILILPVFTLEDFIDVDDAKFAPVPQRRSKLEAQRKMAAVYEDTSSDDSASEDTSVDDLDEMEDSSDECTCNTCPRCGGTAPHLEVEVEVTHKPTRKGGYGSTGR